MLAENLLIFFSDFGTVATLNGVSVKGIFDRPYLEDLNVAAREPVFRCREADAPAPVNKQIAIGGVLYTIYNAEPDGTGLVLLHLRE